MGYSNQFFTALGVNPGASKEVLALSKKTGISKDQLKYYNEHNLLPTGNDLQTILEVGGLTEVELMLRMGRLSASVIAALQDNASQIASIVAGSANTKRVSTKHSLAYSTKLGKLYKGDCLSVLATMEDECVDLIFADPPFNLNKLYPSNIDDSLKTEQYLTWCQEWIKECARVLKPGGALFLWNLPKWNAALAAYMDGYLTFRHWVAVDIKYTLPIAGRLYPSHYSMLYYIKGNKPKTFHPDRLPMLTCPKCYGDLKDYGGYKDKMNPLGINQTDIWLDIPPVRHAKYKRREGANELSLKLLDRVIEMASDPGDVVFDPFGGSGTTYMAAELKNRKWVGCEIGPVDDIISRFSLIDEERSILKEYRTPLNRLFPKDVQKKRARLGLWVCEDFHD